MEEKRRVGEGRYLVCRLSSAGNEKYAEQPNGDRYLVRERLTLLLQRLCGVYVAPCKEYAAQDQMNFNEALIDVFPGNSAICRAI